MEVEQILSLLFIKSKQSLKLQISIIYVSEDSFDKGKWCLLGLFSDNKIIV
jgi:hypothetical protein